MRKLYYDITAIIVFGLYYLIEYNLIKKHVFIVDIFVVAYIVFRLIQLSQEKDFSRLELLANITLIILPLSYLIDFMFDKINYSIPFSATLSISAIGLLLFIGSTPKIWLSKKVKTLKEYGAAMKDVKFEPYSIYLTKDIFLPGHERFTHTQVMGASGTGKTRYAFSPMYRQDIRSGAGMFIFDAKSVLNSKIESYVSESSRDYDYFLFNLGEKGTCTYNPIAAGTPQEIANRINTAFFYEDTKSADFYAMLQKQVLDTLVAVLKAEYPVITFKDIYTCLHDLHGVTKKLCEKHIDMAQAQYLLSTMQKKDIDNHLLGLLNKVNQFANGEYADQINTTNPDFTMQTIIEGDKILLFQANSMVYTEDYKPISVLAMLDLQAQIGARFSKMKRNTQLAKTMAPFWLYLDEFGTVVYPGFDNLIDKTREARVGVILGHQTQGNIAKFGDWLEDAVQSNTGNKIILRTGVKEDAQAFADVIGTKQVERKVEATGADGSLAGRTHREERDYVVHPDDIMNLRTSYEEDMAEAILVINTGKGRVMGKFELYGMPDIEEYTPLKARPKKEVKAKTTNINYDSFSIDAQREEETTNIEPLVTEENPKKEVQDIAADPESTPELPQPLKMKKGAGIRRKRTPNMTAKNILESNDNE